jgi:phage I-like protein
MAKSPTKSQPLGPRTATLAVVLDLFSDGSPPSEFRLFKAGVNHTEIGDFIFDDAAASATMAAYEAHGVDRMVDLEHLSIDQASPNYDPDARASCKLEIRNDGELWAVDVKWTEDGARRLREKTQRYVSPFFAFDDERRVVKIVNIALTAMPATHQTPELVAASIAGAQNQTAALAGGDSGMNPELVKKALDALQAGDAEAAAEILKEMVASAASGGEVEVEAEVAPLQEEPMEEEDEAAAAALADDAEPEAAASVVAGMTQLMAMTGKKTVSEAVLAVGDVYRDHEKFQKDKRSFELGRRKANVIKLQKLGAETPDTSGLAKGQLCDRLLNEDLDEQDKRVAALLKARGGKLPADPKPPTTDNEYGLTEQQLSICAEQKLDPKVFAATLARTKKTNS